MVDPFEGLFDRTRSAVLPRIRRERDGRITGMEPTDPSRDDMRRYLVVVVDHSGGESEFIALTSGGMPKAAYMAGSAFEAKHPRTGIATFRIVEATGKRRDTDLIDRMEW